MNQNYELKENESGTIELHLNDRACVCPYSGQQIIPMPGRIAGQVDLQVYTKKCDSLCPLFDVIKPGNDKLYSLNVTCGIGRIIEDIEFVPYKKKSNLTIH